MRSPILEPASRLTRPGRLEGANAEAPLEVTALAPAEWQDKIRTFSDSVGRPFHYVLLTNPGAATLVVHFSAFFGEWGDAKPYRATFQGYFHRLRMFADVRDHNWLFLCDEYGADRNGTYYTGERGDLFVENATGSIISEAMVGLEIQADRIVTMGSSMGATAALKFGLTMNAGGIIAVAPHIDLDICAKKQDRMRHVGFICPDGDALNPSNHAYTRQIRGLLDHRSDAPPRLFMQACKDDYGVYREQVLSLQRDWTSRGGRVDLDIRKGGGHTSDYATKPLLLEVVRRLLAVEEIDVESLRTRPDFAPITPPPTRSRLRQWAGRARSRVRRRMSGGNP